MKKNDLEELFEKSSLDNYENGKLRSEVIFNTLSQDEEAIVKSVETMVDNIGKANNYQ